MTGTIPIQRTTHSKRHEVDFTSLEFGKVPTDHMFLSLYKGGQWRNASVLPFGNLSLSPFALGLHYGQAVFEGMKAFRMVDGHICVFRAVANWERLQKTLERMSMPGIPKDLFMDGLAALVDTERDWIPDGEGQSLYLRPLVFASEARIGVKISEEYHFLILASPVGAFYPKPLRVRVETKYVRAAQGGVGFAKCAGNYGAAYFPTQLAKEAGYDQVLWTDSRDHAWLEESGTMNIMAIMGDELVTPPLSSSILAGITRDCLLTLAPEFGLKPVERPIGVQELEERMQQGRLDALFGAGTAAIVAPIETVHVNGTDYPVPVNPDSPMFKLKARLESIRRGASADIHGWNELII